MIAYDTDFTSFNFLDPNVISCFFPTLTIITQEAATNICS